MILQPGHTRQKRFLITFKLFRPTSVWPIRLGEFMKILTSMLFLLLSVSVYAQSRPGTGPSTPEASISKDVEKLLETININSKTCSPSPKKFKNLVDLYTYINLRTVLQGDKDCTDGKSKTSDEVICLFEGETPIRLKEVVENKEFVSYLTKKSKISEKQASDISLFYINLVTFLDEKK